MECIEVSRVGDIIRKHDFEANPTLYWLTYGVLPFKNLDKDATIDWSKDKKRFYVRVWYGDNLVTKGCTYKTIEKVIQKMIDICAEDEKYTG